MKIPTTIGKHANTKTGGGQSAFPGTLWSKLMALREGTSDERSAILDFLIRRYWKPVYCFVRRSGVEDEQAKDLVQEFFMVALARNLFAKADPTRGRFRNFLLKSLQHFTTGERWAAGEEIVKCRAEAVHVRRGSDHARFAGGLFGRHVFWRAHYGLAERQIRFSLEQLGESEVGEMRLALGINEDVGRLEIAVQNAALMSVI